jgi:hypoxanthine phosphoribosyltransferase
MVDFVHVTPQELLTDSVRLGKRLYETGFRPKHAISIWRGGTSVGLGVDAFFRSRGIFINHTTIATESYTGIQQQEKVRVKGLGHVIESVCREDDLLIIDDVYETGNTIRAIIETLRGRARANTPGRILVGTIHRKPEKVQYDGVEVVCLYDVPGRTWIDYPHELADLVTDDPDDPLIKHKSEAIWRAVRQDGHEPMRETLASPYQYVDPETLSLDSMKLGVNIFNDRDFHPNFIVALWPGGITAGLPLHEVYKYKLKKTGEDRPVPDHISLNTASTHLTYRTNVLGLEYLAERINAKDNILLVDSIFKSGRFVNDALIRLKEVLRRNLSLDRVRVASVYWNPEDKSTWTVQPAIRKPHYFLKEVSGTIIYPHAFHRFLDPRSELLAVAPDIHSVLYGT